MEIVCNRAKLQLLSINDVRPLYAIIEKHPDVWTYLIAKMDCLEDMERLVEESIEKYKRGVDLPFTVIDQKTNEIVGTTRLYNISNDCKTTELGHTWYSPSVQRTSVNTECKYMMLCYAFEELGMLRVQIKTDARNEKAQRAIERLGAIKEGIMRNERQLPNGFVRDAVVYSIISAEWPKVKERLENKLLCYK
ncbi:GNAT family N-acetyltransferase [Bacillus cytotoxicus]|uniref:GNAT family N-acetyltransferase n=1 Tax=Bacillus cytotoxicus TaxID=580165 RepID=A0ACC6A9Y8_9BACI|nr:GNAT family N-acetyltransferase [Bacillus cytotoxicus]